MTRGPAGDRHDGGTDPMGDPLDDLVGRLPVLAPCRAAIADALDILEAACRAEGALLVCGNGGSAADSEHLVADLMKAFMVPRPVPPAERERLRALGDDGLIADGLQRAVRAIALPSSGAFITAMGNDVSYDLVFAQQVYGLGKPGDVLFAISTTGASPSVVHAARVARLLGLPVVVLTGRDGGALAELADVAIRVPADLVFEIQELHLPVYHAIALTLEQRLFAGRVPADP
jgi:D-sedoheptulose 7-phosphate isomerase